MRVGGDGDAALLRQCCMYGVRPATRLHALGGVRGWVQTACAGEAHMSRTRARRGTGMHALEPNVTALHVCLVKCMRGGGAEGGTMLHGCSMVR